MQEIRYRVIFTKQFRRDLKRVKHSGKNELIEKIRHIIKLLKNNKELPASCRPHKLKGEFMNLEECHISPDWLLVYQRRKDILVITLLRTGSHTDIFDH